MFQKFLLHGLETSAILCVKDKKLSLKVLRVDSEKGHIDISLRRVTKRERIEKIMLWKKERKGEALLREVATKVGLTVDELYQQAGEKIDDKFGIYEGFEKAVKDGPEVLVKIGVPEKIAKAFAEVAEERIHVKMVKVKGVLEIRCMKPNGARVIKEAFQSVKTEKNRAANVKFYVYSSAKIQH